MAHAPKPLIILLSTSIPPIDDYGFAGSRAGTAEASVICERPDVCRGGEPRPERRVARQFFTMTKPHGEIRIRWVGSSFGHLFAAWESWLRSMGKLAGR